MKKKRNVALIGGGKPDAFFGKVHANCIGRLQPLGFALTCGVLSGDPQRSVEYGPGLNIEGLGTIEDLIARKDQISYAVVATTNDTHFDITMKLTAAGIPVVLEKPVTLNLPQAIELAKASAERKVPVTAAYTYPGYAAPTLMKRLIRAGRIGTVRGFECSYRQDWQTGILGIPQEWRRVRGKSGRFNVTGDISTHLVELLSGTTGLEITDLMCVVNSFPADPDADDGLDNDSLVTAWLSESGGVTAFGSIKSSQVQVGCSNDVDVWVYGSRGTVRWRQMEPEKLFIAPVGRAPMVWERGTGVGQEPLVSDLVDGLNLPPLPPGGHIAGFENALTTVHYRFGLYLDKWEAGGRQSLPEDDCDLSLLGTSGVRGMRFLDACGRSLDDNHARVSV